MKEDNFLTKKAVQEGRGRKDIRRHTDSRRKLAIKFRTRKKQKKKEYETQRERFGKGKRGRLKKKGRAR